MHSLFASPWVNPLEHPQEPTGSQGEWFSFGISFFPCRGGDLFSFGNAFAAPRGHTHRICSRQCLRQGEKCLTWYHGQCEKMSKKCAKKLDTFLCYFCQQKVNILWSDNKRLKKVVLLFLTTSKRYHIVGVRTLP